MKKLLFTFAMLLCLGTVNAEPFPQGINNENVEFSDEELYEIHQTDLEAIKYMQNKEKQRAKTQKVLSGVSYIIQEEDNWCGPATIEIIIDYIKGSAPTQHDIAEEFDILESGGTSVGTLTNYLNKSKLGKTYNYASTSSAVYGYLMSTIDKGYPVALNLDVYDMPGAPKKGDGGHWVAGYGYSIYTSGSKSVKDVYIMEPWSGWDKTSPYTYHSGEMIISLDELLTAMRGNSNGGFIIK